MAIQFRRRKSLGPLRFSLSQRGLSTSIGGGPFRLLYGADGKVRRTIRAPGLGIWDTKVIGTTGRRPRRTPSLLTQLGALALYLALLAVIIAVLVAPAVAHADPLRCKDVPGAFGEVAHVCQLPDGTVQNCAVGPLPTMGPPCREYPASSVPPGFWN
jgi:hypothetical protein